MRVAVCLILAVLVSVSSERALRRNLESVAANPSSARGVSMRQLLAVIGGLAVVLLGFMAATS